MKMVVQNSLETNRTCYRSYKKELNKNENWSVKKGKRRRLTVKRRSERGGKLEKERGGE